MSIQYKPLSNDLYSIPKAQIMFKPEGASAFELLGDADEVTIETTVEQTDRYSNEGGVRVLAKTVITQVLAVLNMTLVQLSDRNRALSLLGLLEYATQTISAGYNQVIAAVEHDEKIYKLDHINVSNVVVKDGVEAVTYVLGTDYKLDAKAGFLQLINEPALVDGDLSITYDAPAVVAGDKIAKIGVASKTENRGTVIVRGTQEVGTQTLLTLHDVQLRPSGTRNYIAETDFDTIQVEGRVFRDENQAAGHELGTEQTIHPEA